MPSLAIRICFLVILTVVVSSSRSNLKAQKISSKDIEPYVQLWDNQELDQLFSGMPELVKKFPTNPETIFFLALYNPDAQKAEQMYRKIVEKHADNYFADVSLYRLFQFAYARGAYNQADKLLQLLSSNYQSSKYIAEANFLLDQKLLKKSADTLTTEVEVSKASPYYAVQLGAFSNQSNADNLSAELTRHGYSDVQVVQKTAKGTLFYKVLVGKFDSLDNARLFANDLKSKHSYEFSISYMDK